MQKNWKPRWSLESELVESAVESAVEPKSMRPKKRATAFKTIASAIGDVGGWMLIAFILGCVFSAFCFGVYFVTNFSIQFI
jgi:hypothetical protein